MGQGTLPAGSVPAFSTEGKSAGFKLFAGFSHGGHFLERNFTPKVVI